MAGKKLGDDHAKEMFRRGLAELQAASYFGESTIAQPVSHRPFADRGAEPGNEPTQPEPEVAPAPEIERDR